MFVYGCVMKKNMIITSILGVWVLVLTVVVFVQAGTINQMDVKYSKDVSDLHARVDSLEKSNTAQNELNGIINDFMQQTAKTSGGR